MASNFSQMLSLKSNLHSVFPPKATNTCVPHGSVHKASRLTGDESVTAPAAELVPSLLPSHPPLQLPVPPPRCPDGCGPLPAVPREKHFISGYHAEQDTCRPFTVSAHAAQSILKMLKEDTAVSKFWVPIRENSHKIIYPNCV